MRNEPVVRMTFYETEINRISSICYSNKTQIETVIGARHFINNNVHQQLNLDLLSRVRFTSKFHLLRLFKKYYGQTPMQYWSDRRMDKAKELLREGRTVTETCFEVAFESPSSFSTFFKSREDTCPAEFQKKQLSQTALLQAF
jgi:AraC-like DNA-binding protein